MSHNEPDEFLQFMRSGESLGGDEGVISPGHAVYCAAGKILDLQTGLPFVEIANMDLSPEIIRCVPEDIVKRHRLIPINNENGTVTLALSDMPDSVILDDIRFFIGRNVKLVVTEKDSIEEFIQKYYSNSVLSAVKRPQQPSSIPGDRIAVYDDDIIVEIVNTIISDAISMKASDVHIEPLETRLRVRYRIDGFCYDVNSFEKRLMPPITARIKVMADIDVAEKRLPQDGRIKLQRPGMDVSIRVSTLPVVHGESIVLRILDKSNVRKGLKTLGLLEEDYTLLKSIVSVPDGMMIISGPTGSGKTTTLYAILHELSKPHIKIVTIEDPVEYTLEGVNQIQVSEGLGRKYSRILKHILRHDPNVIMVGEMRDLESVEIAMRSALTGHKVLSTLHTNDAPSVVTRLINMGLPPFMITASVQAVIYQRLVRTLCQACKVPFVPARAEILKWVNRGQGEGLDESGIVTEGMPWFHPGGCRECNFSGYKGRTALFEIMFLNDEIRRLTMDTASSTAIRKIALKHGMRDIRTDGILKVMKGITSISEVLRVT
ncbi:MAG: type II/IV secretion system protein [wastewater metagenome]|nr:type II/IV secretion system protein [Candidatus Loosdrechtia aerotolerans]